MIVVDYKRIDCLAAERNLSLRGLAIAMGCRSPNTLYHIKRHGGRVRNRTAYRLAMFFGVSVESLVVKNGNGHGDGEVA